jgi:hypothetical protein
MSDNCARLGQVRGHLAGLTPIHKIGTLVGVNRLPELRIYNPSRRNAGQQDTQPCRDPAMPFEGGNRSHDRRK